MESQKNKKEARTPPWKADKDSNTCSSSGVVYTRLRFQLLYMHALSISRRNRRTAADVFTHLEHLQVGGADEGDALEVRRVQA